MAFTTIDDSSVYFQTTLYTGNGGTQSITNTGNSDLQPDWVWIKSRSASEHPVIHDSVRGANYQLYPNQNAAESNYSGRVTAFNSDGFSIGGDNEVNQSSQTYVAWNWKAGTSFTNDASSTSVGSIDSAGSVSTDAGFSICSYTGTGSAGTIKHGLSTAPKMIIVKKRNDTNNWDCFHASLGATKHIYLNAVNAVMDNDNRWNDTAPTTSVFSVGDGASVNASSDTYIAYCFAEKQGYSKFGSYVGNGNADGPIIFTGFKPAFVIVKNTGVNENWSMHDPKRNENVSPNFARLTPDDNQTEATNTTFAKVELLSNGFKLGNSADVINDASVTFIYMAFAEQPFVTSTGVPATAR